MRVWRRASVPTFCGNCPRLIATGEPLLLIGREGWLKVRCDLYVCAGEAVPTAIADGPLIETAAADKFALMTRVDAIAHGDYRHDWKLDQSGRDE